ncbi:hypothetical protein Tsubulata_013579 [Turnera subulata]|uniref:Single-stranded DNA binding protein Ssb-like OB fold domain-containing protein n=1 Tax=Turnera subulata TaxID=218843 RepID=A0A9Q0EZ61_9ROSI|nr:hypothetical protein Tsubulata_013579 [Turnera subulata]
MATPQAPPASNQAPQPATTTEKRKPTFVKVEDLKPGTKGHNVVVKVVRAETISPNRDANNSNNSTNNNNNKPRRAPMSLSHRPARPSRIAECLVGDDSASIIFTARNEQVDVMKPGTTVILRNAKIDMFKSTMRLAVDKWGRIEVTDPASFVVKEDNNLSQVEYELVTVQG